MIVQYIIIGILAIAVISVFILYKNKKTSSTCPNCPKDTHCPKDTPCPIQTPCPTCPIQTPCPRCPVQTPCPNQTPCPKCPIQTPCPTRPVQTPCPTRPVQTPCPKCPIQTPCPNQTPCPTRPVQTPCPNQTPCPKCPSPITDWTNDDLNIFTNDLKNLMININVSLSGMKPSELECIITNISTKYSEAQYKKARIDFNKISTINVDNAQIQLMLDICSASSECCESLKYTADNIQNLVMFGVLECELKEYQVKYSYCEISLLLTYFLNSTSIWKQNDAPSIIKNFTNFVNNVEVKCKIR